MDTVYRVFNHLGTPKATRSLILRCLMTLNELCGCGGAVIGIIMGIAAGLFFDGSAWVIVCLAIGMFFVGWMLGVLVVKPLERSLEKRAQKRSARTKTKT